MTYRLGTLTWPAFEQACSTQRVVVLLPIGSVEPHGPHLALDTDSVLSEGVAERAARQLEQSGWRPLIAPTLPYGVTNCAQAFAGAVTVRPDSLTAILRDIVTGYLGNGVAHVCVINNHLEPGQESAARAAVDGLQRVSYASPLEPRWGRTLSAEFKSGQCHAGEYESSMMLAIDAGRVDDTIRTALAPVPVSLSEMLSNGVTDFREMGMSNAYAGDPASATAADGEEQLGLLATMVVAKIAEGSESP